MSDQNNNIVKTEMIPFKLTEECDKCSSGEIIRDSSKQMAYMTNPMRFDVKCTNEDCDYISTRTEDNLYPKIIFEVKK